jgi:hypothetical protein
MTTTNSETIMPSETRNWFMTLLNRVFHRTKNNPKINPHHTTEQKKIILEGALNSLIPANESTIDVITQKNKVEQWKHNKKNDETTSNFESSQRKMQPASVANVIDEAASNELIAQHEDNISQIELTAEGKLNIALAFAAEQAALNQPAPVLNLADAEPTRKALQACISDKENEEAMQPNIDTTKLNDTEIVEYANERVSESPLKKTLAGIKFPSKAKKPIKLTERAESNDA